MRIAKTTKELLELGEKLRSDPNNRNTSGGIFLYNASTRKKLDKIAREITENMIAAKKANGTYVAPDGYSGRQTNRRK